MPSGRSDTTIFIPNAVPTDDDERGWFNSTSVSFVRPASGWTARGQCWSSNGSP